MDQQELEAWEQLAQAIIEGSKREFELPATEQAYKVLAVVYLDGDKAMVHPKRWIKKSIAWARKIAILYKNSAIAEIGINADHGFMVRVLPTESYGFLSAWANRYPNNHHYNFAYPVLRYVERKPSHD